MKLKLFALFALILITALAAWFYLQNATPLDDYELHRGSVANAADTSKRVEYVWVEPTLGRPWPVVIYVHGYQGRGKKVGGRIFFSAQILQRMAEKGVLAVAVSMPGYGYSTGKPDFSGPLSQGALRAVINVLRARDDILPRKIALIGFSRGAVVAANVAAEDRMLAGAVLMSGVYDFQKMIAKWKTLDNRDAKWLVGNFEEEAGMSVQAIADRSVMTKARTMNVPVLAIHGEKDTLTDPGDAQQLVNQLKKRNIYAKLVVYPTWEHAISDFATNTEVSAFFNQVLH